MNVGEGLIPGRSPENARSALAAAADAGVSADSVRTCADGYVVPKSVLDAHEARQAPKRTSGSKGNRVKRTTKASKETTNG